jgi:hypothetical protein
MSADLRALATKEKCVQVSCGQTYSALLFESGVVRSLSSVLSFTAHQPGSVSLTVSLGAFTGQGVQLGSFDLSAARP